MIIVLLRRPGKNDPRTDPFYEFGSFGITGCHGANLLRDGFAVGYRLAFVQGGPLGFRLVMLTPPVEVRDYPNGREAVWSPVAMPLRYDHAPLLIANFDLGGLSELRPHLRSSKRRTWEGRFASAFRSRKKPLSSETAASIVELWAEATRRSGSRATHYWEALPRRPDIVDERRQWNYQLLRAEALA